MKIYLQKNTSILQIPRYLNVCPVEHEEDVSQNNFHNLILQDVLL
jgi:hypothetical protein